MSRLTLLAAALLALAPPAFADAEYYLVASIAEQSDSPPSRAQARVLRHIYEDLAAVSGVDAELVWSTDPDINAFATEVGDEKIVVVNEGLLAMLGRDRDAVAATLGHELAHHKADHIRAGRRKQEGVRVFGAILGAVVGAKVGRNAGGFAGAASAAAVGAGAHLIALKFNRNQELEADRLAVEWMIAAGYNPNGMIRLQETLGALSGKSKAGILSTHPASAKRRQAAEKHIAKLDPADDLIARPVAPLVGDDALADATAEIAAVEQAARDEEARTVAAALQPAGAPSAAALEPIDGVAFDTYAALGNELLYSGDKPAVLKRHSLSEQKLASLTAGFTARMREEPALTARYSASFFRASQGRFAAHGRDLANSFESGAPLQLEPPYPIETARELHFALEARGVPNVDATAQAAIESELLRPHGITYYDYLIAHNWWARKATIAALAGDTSLMQAFFAPPQDAAKADAEAAGVHIGENVKVGKGVRIGGKE